MPKKTLRVKVKDRKTGKVDKKETSRVNVNSKTAAAIARNERESIARGNLTPDTRKKINKKVLNMHRKSGDKDLVSAAKAAKAINKQRRSKK